LQINSINLTDRVAVITGGAQGIGLTVARRFLESGARVCLWDVNGEALAQVKKAFGAEGHDVPAWPARCAPWASWKS